jgi:prepilin-type N-terminal cleavage/methylation domain-containing protein
MKPKRKCRDRGGARGEKETPQLPRGFTLIEVMMVVAIIGLTLTMGLPSFLRVIERQGMRKAEYEMVEACKEARRAAIMNNQITSLILHPLLGTFEVPGAFKQAQLPNGVIIDILGVNFIQYERADEAKVRFFPNGTSDEFTIVLHSSGGRPLEIDLDTIAALPVVKDL